VLTDRDLKFVESFEGVDPARLTVADAMIEKPYAVGPDTPLDDVVSTMASEKYGSAIVVQNHKVVGIFTTVDACRALAELLSTRLQK
jgi:acetoin utilization protein AcuB